MECAADWPHPFLVCFCQQITHRFSEHYNILLRTPVSGDRTSSPTGRTVQYVLVCLSMLANEQIHQ